MRRAFREAMGARASAGAWPEEWDGWDDPDGEQPEILLSLGYEHRFGRGFQARGRHRALELGQVRPAFRSIVPEDPCARATMYAATPYVMLVDRRVLGPLPVPRRWSDLLEPDYRGEIAAPGGTGGISFVVLLHYHQRHGMDGLRRFARSVRTCSHGARLAREAREGGASAAISIVPWIFARCAQEVDTEVVWPEEGAIASPMWISVREDATDRAVELARFVVGPELGTRLARKLRHRAKPRHRIVPRQVPGQQTFGRGQRLEPLGKPVLDHARGRGGIGHVLILWPENRDAPESAP